MNVDRAGLDVSPVYPDHVDKVLPVPDNLWFFHERFKQSKLQWGQIYIVSIAKNPELWAVQQKVIISQDGLG